MNKYPSYLTNEPKPLVFLTGTIDNEPDIHANLIKVFQISTKDSENKEQPPISFRSVSSDYSFPEKKPQKEQLSIEGILKYNWPAKHFESVPSVVVYTVAISVDWGPTEWQRKEFLIQEKFNKLKNILSPRDIKLMVVAIRTGAGSIEKDVIDERITSFKRHLQLNSNIFAFISPSEVVTDNTYLKKVSKSIKESSSAFYVARVKSLKSVLKSISEKYRGAIENMLHARFCFKIAFFYEFQGQTAHALKYYRQCYTALSASIETIDEEMFEQVKIVAEMAHYKICNMLLFSTSVLEAFQQFKTHMTRFSKLYSEFPWKHYAWVSDQYVVFTQLLELYAVNDSLPDADRAYYYHNAARYSQKRQMSFEKTRKELDLQKGVGVQGNPSTSERLSTSGGREVFKGMILMPPKFIGSPAQILDPVLDQLQPSSEESARLYNDYMVEQEYKVAHSAVIMRLLTLALEKGNPNFKRRKGFILSLIAEQCIKEEQFAIALQHLCQSADLLTAEGWVAPAVAVLGLIMRCATLLGRSYEYLNAALTLYANAPQLFYSRYELEELHLNVLTILESTLQSTHATVKSPILPKDCFQYRKFAVHNKTSFLSNSSFVSVIQKSEYGSCATTEKPAEYCLNDSHTTIDMSHIKKMFTVDVSFDHAAIELGHKVLCKLSLTSKFMDDLSVDEIKIYFTDNAIIKRVVNSNKSSVSSPTVSARRPSAVSIGNEGENYLLKRLESSEDLMNQHMSNNSDIILTPLTFVSNKALVLEFYIYISETGFASFLSADAILCLESVELIINNEIKTDDGVINKQIIFDVAALPENVIKARKQVLKPMLLKDIIKYTFNENFPTVTIQKPSALVTMTKPVVPPEGLSLLQGVIHRINVYFKVGACDMLDGCVYLSSDYNPTCDDDSLFWYPDRNQLSEVLSSHSNPSDDLLDSVRFHALTLNDSLQPAVPLSLGPVCPTDSVLFVPVFVKSSYVQVTNIKLRIEYVPRGRLKSSLTKEFSIKVNFLKALDMTFKVAPSGMAHDTTPGTLFIGDENLLTVSLNCCNSLSHALGISQCTLEVHPMNDPAIQTVIIGNSATSDKMSANLFESVADLSKGSKFPVQLRGGDSFSECQYIQCGTRGKIVDTSELPAFSVGGVTVHWRQLRRHLLRHTLKNNSGVVATMNSVDWLPILSHRAALEKRNYETLNYNTTISSIGASYFSIPDTKLMNPPFIVSVDYPSISTFGQVVGVKVTVKSQQSTSVRLKFSVTINENFLLSGSTACSLEIPSFGEQNVSLTIVPLKCGFLPLPSMLITWERSPSDYVKVLDTVARSTATGGQTAVHSVFVNPCEINQQ